MVSILAIDDLHKWLDPPSQRPTTYEAKKQTNGCAWFFDDQFDDWKARKNGLYWVYGNAGAGKSVLSFSIVDKLQADATLPVVYFHFDFNDSKKQDCRALVSSLVFQLGTLFEDCLAYLKEKHSPANPPTYDQLLPMLSHLLGLSGCAFLIIDALDECPDSAREKGLKALLDTLCGLDEDRLRLIITSRPEPDIRKCISSRATHSLSFHDAVKHMEDLRIHIETQLSNRDLYNWPDGVRTTVQRVLFEKSKGMFLWVNLQLRPLRRCHNQEQVERVLDKLPGDLNATYERILTNFEAPDFSIEQARHAFECVAFAQRPLSPAEVAVILSSTFDSSIDTPVVSASGAPIDDPEAFIRDNCPRLLDIVISDEGENVVQFIHFSALEYLTSPALKEPTSHTHQFAFDEEASRLTLARICISALIAADPLSEFQSYADEHWMDLISSRKDNILGEILFRFLHLGSPSFTRWALRRSQTPKKRLHMLQILQNLAIELRDGDYRRYTALHMATKLGLCQHVTRILESPHGGPATSIDDVVELRGDRQETALHIAARSGHTEIARVLLSHGALVDDTDERGSVPLHLAASSGCLDVLRMLLEGRAAHGSNTAVTQCSVCDEDGRTALHYAAKRGDSEACRVLLEHGALVDVTDNNGNTPLQLAEKERRWEGEGLVEGCHPDVARVLLEYGAAHDGPVAQVVLLRPAWQGTRTRREPQESHAVG